MRARVGALLLLLLPLSCGEPTVRPDLPPLGFDGLGRPTRPVDPPQGAPNLVLVVIDTLRADALDPDLDPGARPMPFLAGLAESGVQFRNAVAPAPWTLPSMTSLLTGLLPSQHGMNAMRCDRPLIAAIPTYAEVLREAYGYETAAFVDGPWFEGACESVLQGFTHRERGFALQGLEERVGAWNRERDPARPFFLLLHTLETHAPYGAANHPWPAGTLEPVPPPAHLLAADADPAELFRTSFLDARAWLGLQRALGAETLGRKVQAYEHAGFAADPRPELAAELASAYWDGVRWTDGLLARAHGALQRMGLLENALLVVAGDHGEAFGEHDAIAHGRWLYDVLVHVPLVMTGPARLSGGHLPEGAVGLVDVLPTFLDLAGLAGPADVAGQSALPLLDDPARCRPVVAEERLDWDSTGTDVDQVRVAARTRRWKYVATLDRRTGEVREEAYDLAADPGERFDLGGGTGRLPPGLVFDACLCPAVEAVRSRVWTPASVADDPSAVPYGALARPVTAPPPLPCRGREG